MFFKKNTIYRSWSFSNKCLPCNDRFESLWTPPNVTLSVFVIQEGQSGCVHVGPPKFAPKPGGPLVCTLLQVRPPCWILLQEKISGFTLVQGGTQWCTLVQAGPLGCTLEQ